MSPDRALTLFVSGTSEPSLRALHNVTGLCHVLGIAEDDIEVVDLVKNPQMAEDARILATPTLVRWEPVQRRIVGDLADHATVGHALGLSIPRESS